MEEGEIHKINPNTADEKTLQQLPGIGLSLAQRIMASRPFSGLEDMKYIRGLGKVALERLEPHLSFAESTFEEKIELDQELDVEEIKLDDEGKDKAGESILTPDGQRKLKMTPSEARFEITKEVLPEDKDTWEKTTAKKESASSPRISLPVITFSRTESLWLMGAAGLATLILSVLVSLAVIGGINGTLDFNRLQTVRQLEVELGDVQGNLETLSSSVSILDERLTPLEGLTGRMITVEGQVDAIQGDIAEALASVESMQSDLDGLLEETARLTGRVDRFDTFLDGLRNLISELFAAPSIESLPQE